MTSGSLTLINGRQVDVAVKRLINILDDPSKADVLRHKMMQEVGNLQKVSGHAHIAKLLGLVNDSMASAFVVELIRGK